MLIIELLGALALAQSPDTLTLQQALERARSRRPMVVAAAAGVVRARGSAQLLRQIPNPSAQFESDNLAPIRKVTVVQSLAWLPRYASDRAAGNAGVDRARADSIRLMAETARDVRRTFFGALAAHEELTLAAEQNALADSLAGLASRRAAAGDISDLERDQVKLEASRSTLAAAQAHEADRIARAELGRAVAWQGMTWPVPAGSLDDGLNELSAADLEAIRLEVLPFVRAAVADSSAAAARLRSARIGRIPFPGLLVGREWGSTPDGRPNAIIGAAMPIPLWSWGGEAVPVRGSIAVAATTRLSPNRQRRRPQTPRSSDPTETTGSRDSPVLDRIESSAESCPPRYMDGPDREAP